jgi:MarR family transcriptional regulator, organic hydroperoxide resistance regulator
MTTPVSLQTNIIFLCGDFTHVFQQALTRAFRDNNIPVTIEQFAVLAVLFYQNGINQKDIGKLLGRDKTTITRIISNMIKNKVIHRISDERDSRGKLIYLTPKGKAVQKKAVRVSGELYTKALRNIDGKDLSQAMGLVAQMIKNVHTSR